MRSLLGTRRSRRWLAPAIIAGLLSVHASRAQFGNMGSPPASPPPNRQVPPPGETNPFPPDMQRKALKMQNEQRQQRIVSDSKKLLALAQQLQAEVGSAGKNTLSASMLKKTEEIEKLARSVKDKMKAP